MNCMDFGRLLTAMITPFDEALNVNYQEAARIAKHLIDTGSSGIILAGTTGESPTLSPEEKDRLYLDVKHVAGKEIPVIMGAGTNSTSDTIKAVECANRLGADGIMLVVPYYNKPSQEGLYEHFKQAAERAESPVILYNIPGRTGCSLEPETVCRLAELPQITAIKEASGNLSQVTEIRRNTPEDFLIYSGDDAMTLPMLSVGGHGIISVTAHVAGNLMADMIRSWEAGNTKRAAALHNRLYPLFKTLFIAPNPAPVKYAMSRIGFDTQRLRLPMTEVSEKDKTIIEQVLNEFGDIGI